MFRRIFWPPFLNHLELAPKQWVQLAGDQI